MGKLKRPRPSSPMFPPPPSFPIPFPLSTPSSLPEAACLTRDLWRGLSLCWTLVLCTGLPGLEPHRHPREACPAFPVLSAVTVGCHGRLPDVCSWVSSTGHDCPPRWAWLCDQVVFWLPQDFKVPVGGARLQWSREETKVVQPSASFETGPSDPSSAGLAPSLLRGCHRVTGAGTPLKF